MQFTIEKDLGGSVQRKNLTEQLYEILETRILNGTILPGTKLSEENVAEAFRVSRSPAREAITELERIGLATRTGARDRAVAMPTEDFIRETFEVWWILDAGRTYLASLEAGPEDHKRLYELLDEIDRADLAGDEETRNALTVQFHELIYRGFKNEQLQRILDDYGKYIRWFKELYFKPVDKSKASRVEHRQIVERYAEKDLMGLTDLIRRHILRQRDEVIANFSEANDQALEPAPLNLGD
jgi:DNA-binding GntR family transcriptional regulator